MYSGQTRSIHFLGQVAVESREGSEEPTIDQVRIMGRPDRQPAQGENVKFFFVSNQLVRPHIDQYNCLKSPQQYGGEGEQTKQ